MTCCGLGFVLNEAAARRGAKGLGLQVAGFGAATSYYYPGGLNLIHISEPPMIPVVK